MKKLSFFFFWLFVSIAAIAQTQKKAPAKPKSGGTRYVFVTVSINAPEFDDYTTERMKYTKNYYKPHIISFNSEVVTISGYNEEKEYRLTDKFRQQVYDEEVRFYHSTMDPEETARHIVSAKAYSFHSYKEASIARNGE